MNTNTYILSGLTLGFGAPALHVLYSYLIGRLCRSVIAKRRYDWHAMQIWVFTGVTTGILFLAVLMILGGYVAPMYWVNNPHAMTTEQAVWLFAIMFFLPPPIIHGVAFKVTGRSRVRRGL